MINKTIPESDFRADKAAVEDLATFLKSPSGQKFACALRGGHPVRPLGDKRCATPENLRTSAMNETATEGTAPCILGTAKGYEMAIQLIDRLTEHQPKEEASASTSQKSRVARAMQSEATE